MIANALCYIRKKFWSAQKNRAESGRVRGSTVFYAFYDLLISDEASSDKVCSDRQNLLSGCSFWGLPSQIQSVPARDSTQSLSVLHLSFKHFSFPDKKNGIEVLELINCITSNIINQIKCVVFFEYCILQNALKNIV